MALFETSACIPSADTSGVIIPINPPDEGIGGQEAHGTSQKTVHGAGEETVTEEKQT